MQLFLFRTAVFSVCFLSLILSMLLSAPTAHAILSDTGQTSCWDGSGNSIACPAPGNKIAQDGTYSGSQPHFDVSADGTTVTDLNTNLIWQQADDGNTYKWTAGAGETSASDYCENLTLGGLENWRLPTIKELSMLINYEKTDPACFPAFSCKDDRYWSSTPCTLIAGQAWSINFQNGRIFAYSESNGYSVRCVHGAPSASQSLTVDGNTISDATTGLVWKNNGGLSAYPISDTSAITASEHCENLSLAGKDDWRLPDIHELQSIVDYTKSEPALDANFNLKNRAHYWTSTTYAGGPTYSWYINFQSGIAVPQDHKNVLSDVVCVRGGPGGSPTPSASLTGAPEGTVEAKNATIEVAGSNVVQYRYKVDSSSFSAPTDIATKIELSGLTDGAHTVQVLGINSIGKLQGNPTTATWTVGKKEDPADGNSNGTSSDSGGSGSSGSSATQPDGSSPNNAPSSPNADKGFTFPAFDLTKYYEVGGQELRRIAGSGTVSLQAYTGWEARVGDATALTDLKSGNSDDIAAGLNMLLPGGQDVERVLSGLVSASGIPVFGDYALFTRNTPSLVLRYALSDVRFVKIKDGSATALPISTEPISALNTEDIYIYLRDSNGNIVTDSFTGAASIYVWVKDNGAWDSNPEIGKVDDPGTLTTVAPAPATALDGSSSTGCMFNPSAGFGMEWLLLAFAPFVAWMRGRKDRKPIVSGSAMLLCLLLLPSHAHAVLSDTGQTSCWDGSGNSITCPAPGDPLAQDGTYIGSQPHFDVSANGTTVTDLNTELIWQHTDDGTERIWSEAVSYCDGLSQGGYDDWRLPAVEELSRLVNAEKSFPACFSAFSCQSDTYWSSDIAKADATKAWVVNFKTGSRVSNSFGIRSFVRCVRGTSSPPASLTDNGDTVSDATTGLTWQKADDGNTYLIKETDATKISASQYCENLSLGGEDDWRLPDLNEFQSIVDYTKSNPASDSMFTARTDTSYWTSSSYADLPQQSWNVNYYTGVVRQDYKNAQSYVRCVRGGLSQSPNPSATLTGAPEGTVEVSNATIAVAGSDVSKYRYKVDSAPFSAPTDIATKIELSGLAVGSHTVLVLGINSLGKLQAEPTSATWTVGAKASLTATSTPANAERNVSRNTTVAITFSMEMKTSGVDVSISPLQATDYTTSWSSDKKTLTVTFKQKLAAATTYTLTIPATAEATDGTVLVSKFEASFTTRAASADDQAAEAGGAPARPDVEAMLSHGGVSTSSTNALAADGILLLPAAITQSGPKGAATGNNTDRDAARADAESFCAIVADAHMAAGFVPANTIAEVKGVQAHDASSSSAAPKIMTLYAAGYLSSGAEFFPRLFKANEATASTYEFSYVDALTSAAIKEAADGDNKAGFALMNPATGAVIQPADNLPALPGGYTLLLFIRDNSLYDTNSAWGDVEDPSYLTSGPTTTSGSSSSGCMFNPSAGFGMEWLLFAFAPFVAWMRGRKG